MTLRGRKQGKAIILEQEPPIADGTEAVVTFDGDQQRAAGRGKQWDALMRIGFHPDFAKHLETTQKEWKPEEY